MAGRPHVSVCIRAHARRDELRSAIASALGQTYGDFEVVVSDDGGGLEAVVAEFGDPRVRYDRSPHPAGPTANLIRVVSLARGDLIAVLNDDDEWLPGFLAATVGVLDADPDVGVAFTADFLEVAGRRLSHQLPFRPGRHDRFLPALLEHSLPPTATVIRRAVWVDETDSVSIPRDAVGIEHVWLRAASDGRPFYYVDEPLAISGLNREQVSLADDGLPERQLATYNSFRFTDPTSEQLRRARVAEFLLTRAHRHLVRRRLHDARADIAHARVVSPRPLGLRAVLALSGVRRLVVRWGCAHPRALIAVLKLWRRIRPPVVPAQS